jgi:hypothetical protein
LWAGKRRPNRKFRAWVEADEERAARFLLNREPGVTDSRSRICRKIPVIRLEFSVLRKNFPDGLLGDFAEKSLR